MNPGEHMCFNQGHLGTIAPHTVPQSSSTWGRFQDGMDVEKTHDNSVGEIFGGKT